MTLWNPLNVFSGRTSSAPDAPTASFDPSRTGDPLGPRPTDPAFGTASTQVTAPARTGDPHRNPIGFAPPAREDTEPRFRTEISFRRHHELPRASTTPEQPDDRVQAAWESPHPAMSVEGTQPEQEPVAEAPVADESVPFYKREISFRRKKPAAVADPILADPPDEPSAVAAEADAQAEAEVQAEAEAAAEAPSLEASEVAVHDEADQLDTDTDEGTPDDPVALDEQDDLSLTESAVAAAVAVGFGSSTEAPEVAPEAEVTAASEAVEDVLPVAAVAAEATADEADLPDLAEVAEVPEVAADDTPPAAGRFGARKRKAERAPRRQGGKARKTVGLKIGSSQLAAAVVTETENGRELLELARRSLAAGIVVDGEVRDESALVHAVKTFFEEEKLPQNDVRIGLSSNRIGVRTLDIECVEDESRFDNAVRFKAHEVLPVALSESVLDYRVLEERVADDGTKMRRVLLVVAPRDQVEPYARVANLAGIKLGAIDLEALALLRAFVEPGAGSRRADDTASVIVSIGHESSTLLVSGGGACEFTRVFDWGGGVLEEAIATSLDVRPAEAAMILRHLSLSGPGRQYEPLDDAARTTATEAIRQRLTPFARELVNSLQFYQTQAESLGIGGILITGGTSHLEGIDGVLHQMIGVNVAVGDPLSRVIRTADFEPDIETALGSLAVPIGLAIDDASVRGVNLLPKDVVTRKSRRKSLVTIGAPVAVAVPLAAMAVLYLGAHSKVVDRQNELAAVSAELAALPQPTVPVIDTAVGGDEAVRATAVANVLGGRLAWESVFRDMSRVLPGNVWLNTLSLTNPDAAVNLADGTVAAPVPAAAGAQPTPSAVSIDGYTYTQPDVARLLARLATLPSLKRVTLTSSQGQLLGSKKVVHFVIVADLNQIGGAS